MDYYNDSTDSDSPENESYDCVRESRNELPINVKTRNCANGFSEKNFTVPSNNYAEKRITQLSSNIRQLNASLHASEHRNAELLKRLMRMEKEKESLDDKDIRQESCTLEEVKSLKEHLRTKERQNAELKGSNQVLQKELKLAVQVIEDETGERIENFMTWLSTSKDTRQNNRKSKNELIAVLKHKNSQLKAELRSKDQTIASFESSRVSQDSQDEECTGATTISLDALDKFPAQLFVQKKAIPEPKEDTNNKEFLAKMKAKLSAAVARISVLSREIEELKIQRQRLLEKNQHDDELVQTLISFNDELKAKLKFSESEHSQAFKEAHLKVSSSEAERQQLRTEVNQLKKLLAEKQRIRISVADFGCQTSNADSVPKQEEYAKTVGALNAKIEALQTEIIGLGDILRERERRCEKYVAELLERDKTNKKSLQQIAALERKLNPPKRGVAKVDSGLTRKARGPPLVPVQLSSELDCVPESVRQSLSPQHQEHLDDFLLAQKFAIKALKDETSTLKSNLEVLERDRKKESERFLAMLNEIHSKYSDALNQSKTSS